MKSLTIWLAVAGGGAIGAVLRHGVSQVSLRAFGPSFPWGTFTANVAGCVATGLLVVFLAGREANPSALRAFLAVGVLGGFTTFSAFALDVVTLYRERAFAVAALYFGLSVILSVGGLVAGMVAGRSLW